MQKVTIEIPDLPDIERNGVMYEFSGEVRPPKYGECFYHFNEKEYAVLWAAEDHLPTILFPIARAKKWVPKDGEKYETIASEDGALTVIRSSWDSDSIDINRFEQNNIYKPGTSTAQADLERMLAARKNPITGEKS